MHEVVYTAIKVVHIGSLIVWLGPSLGGWWILRAGNRCFGEPGLYSHFLYLVFFKLVKLEHIALSIVLASGAALAWLSHVALQPWLILKLLILGIIVLPIEAMDIWFAHYKLTPVFKTRHPMRPYSHTERQLLLQYHRHFVRWSIVMLPPALLGIFWLAIAKPAWMLG